MTQNTVPDDDEVTIPDNALIVFYDDQGEPQVMTKSQMHPAEMRLVLLVCAAKLELLSTRMMIHQHQQQMARQMSESGLLLAHNNVDRMLGL